MPRPIWTGAISFGLLNIPVQLMSAERRVDLRFHMLDSRNNKRVRYERVNAETGEEVPWKDIVKAFEYSKGNYVVLEEEDIKEAAPESKESVDIETFIDPSELSVKYYDRPYYLVPTRKSEKGYVLLRETLREQKKAGLARVVIRTREYLALVLPEDAALVLFLLRFPQELVPADEYAFPEGSLKSYKIAPRELEMASQLVSSMVSKWNPELYRDEFRERLTQVIEARVKKGRRVKAAEPEAEEAEVSTNVVDFMSLLQKSIADNKRTPAARGLQPAAKPAAPAKKARAPKKAAAAKKKAAR
jgi:DNA end-binding protein Ku